MTRVSLRGIRSHLGRFLMSILAVLLGVGFVAGTFSLRSMLSSTFEEIVTSSVDGQAYVQGAELETVGDSGAAQSAPFPMALADTIDDVDGVAAAIPDVEGPIVLVGADGTAVMTTGPPSFGMGLDPDDESMSIVDGRVPSGPDEIVLESAALERSALAIGDTTTVVIAGEVRKVELVGEVGFDAPMAGAIMVGLDTATAVAAYAPDGTTTSIEIVAEEGVEPTVLVDDVQAALAGVDGAEGTRVLTGDEMRDDASASWEPMLGFISTFLLVFAGIALFVGAFIITNTFAMVVRQSQREFAMLRAVGASPVQVFGSVLAQAAVIGVVGAVLGIGAGLGLVAGLKQMFAGMGMELSGDIPLDGSIVAISIVTGTLVSLVAAVIPARRAALTAPVEAMRDDITTHDRSSRLRAAAGAVLLAGGLAGVFAATTDTIEDGATVLGLGAVAVVISVLMLAPTVVPGALAFLAAPVVRLMRPLGGLARGNLTRHPKRTASTASALMIGMALVGAASVMAASVQGSVSGIIANEAKADLMLQSASQDVPSAFVDEVAGLDEVSVVDPLLFTYTASVNGEPDWVGGVPEGFFETAVTVPVEDGSTSALADGQAAVQATVAEDKGWAIGDTITVSGAQGERDVTIGAIIDSQAIGLNVIVTEEVFRAVISPGDIITETVFVTVAPGVSVDEADAAIAEVAAPYVVVSVMDAQEFTDSLAGQVNDMLVVLYALLGLSIVIAVLGIVNTLALSITERTREIGLLRAVGLGRLQLATVVTIESVLTAVFGTVLGVGVGAGLASAMPSVFAEEGFTTLVIPWGGLGVLLGLAVVVGGVAAVWPAVRASRMDVLEAIAYE